MQQVAAEEAEDAAYLKDHRYWYGACKAMMLRGWPLTTAGTLSFRDGASEAWMSFPVSISNLIATNVPSLGLDRPIDASRKLDDGKMTLSWMAEGKVLGLCARFMCSVYGLGAWARFMCSVYVLGLCARCMCSVYVLGVWARCMGSVYGLGLCARCMGSRMCC
jgi:hypothetical protein